MIIIKYVNTGRMIKVKAILIVKISGKSLFGNEYIPMLTKYKSKYVPIITASKGMAMCSLL
jgi:hypothetical protein